MSHSTTFSDGWYGVFPDGGCYEAAQVRNNEIVDCISESEAGSHRNGSNWHYIPVHDAIDDLDEDDLGNMFGSEDDHAAFLALLDRDWEPSCVHVCKLP